jgi:hypothetical protein
MPTVPEPGYRLKLRRAYEQLHTIDHEIRRFQKESLQGAVAFDPQPVDGWEILRLGEVPALDPMVGVYLGDFAHNARSALDNLVCSMIRLTDATSDLKHAAFPVFEGEQKWISEILNRRRAGDGAAPTDGVSSDVLAAIEASQPYKIRGKAARRDASLQILAVISNADKHRAIPVVRIQLASDSIAKRTVNIEPRGIYSITSKVFAKPGTVIETGAEIVRLKTRHIAPPDTNVNVYPDTGAQLGYALEIIFAIDDGQHEFSHLAIWKILGDVWKAVLRVERAAGINGLPLPHPDWTWEPEDL